MDELLRRKEIDIAKGIGIISVVYGHTFTSLHTYIFIFHLPLFFIISGFLYASKEKETAKAYICRKTHSLILQYLILMVVINALLLGFFKLTGQYMPIYPSMLFRPYGAAVTLWFLLCLFWVNVIYKLIDEYVGYNYKAATVVLFFVLGRILSSLDLVIPTYMDTAFTSLVFYLAGIILYKYFNLFNMKLVMYIFCISLLPCVLINLPTNIDLMTNKYEPFYFMFLSVTISFIVIKISHWHRLVSSKAGDLLAYLGRISLVILAFHLLTFELFYKLVSKDILSDTSWKWSEPMAILMAITTIAIIASADKLLNINRLLNEISHSHKETYHRIFQKEKTI